MSPEGWIRPCGTVSCKVNWHWSDTRDDVPRKWAFVAVDAEGNDCFAEGSFRILRP